MSTKTKKIKLQSRNDLLKLDKKALVKLCKKLKVSYSGNKADMIDRITPKLASVQTLDRHKRDKWFNSLQEVNKYGFKRRTGLTITGFLNDVDPNHQCPMDLIMILVAYFGGFLDIKFDILSKYFPNDIKDEGTLIHRKVNKHKHEVFQDVSWSTFIIYACSKGFDQGYHEWHIKCKCKSNTKIPKDWIGIVTDLDDVKFNNDVQGEADSFSADGDYYW